MTLGEQIYSTVLINVEDNVFVDVENIVRINVLANIRDRVWSYARFNVRNNVRRFAEKEL